MVPASLEAILESACSAGASDVLLQSGETPLARVDGRLVSMGNSPLASEDVTALWLACGASEELLDFDGALSLASGERFRVNLHRRLGRRGIALRRVRQTIPPLADLGVPELLAEWAGRPSGLIMVGGPTGSGKSTTVAALLESLNLSKSLHVVTIEDPVEFLFTSKNCVFTQREVGLDTPSFQEGLRRSLRQNPDVIFVGEIRDGTSASTAIQAAETGHLVIATIHSSNCPEVIARLALLFPPEDRDAARRTLASQLVGVLCQKLLPATDGGRVLAAEYLTNAASSRRLIEDGDLPGLHDFLRRGDTRTCGTFLEALTALVRNGRITEETALAAADNPSELARALRGIGGTTAPTSR